MDNANTPSDRAIAEGWISEARQELASVTQELADFQAEMATSDGTLVLTIAESTTVLREVRRNIQACRTAWQAVEAEKAKISFHRRMSEQYLNLCHEQRELEEAVKPLANQLRVVESLVRDMLDRTSVQAVNDAHERQAYTDTGLELLDDGGQTP